MLKANRDCLTKTDKAIISGAEKSKRYALDLSTTVEVTVALSGAFPFGFRSSFSCNFDLIEVHALPRMSRTIESICESVKYL